MYESNSKGSTSKELLDRNVKFSFTITYILLMTTATITFIEAIRTRNDTVRHVLNLETCISVVAGYFYSVFVGKLDEYEKNKEIHEFPWEEITETRYIDWCITTPMMLLTLCLVLSRNSKTEIHLHNIIVIVALNYVMLYMGYLGETARISKGIADVLGFLAFFGMFYLVYRWYVSPRPLRDNYILYGLYLCIWSLYGVVYMLDQKTKNITMNILDLTAKCLIGLGLWVYYTKIVRL